MFQKNLSRLAISLQKLKFQKEENIPLSELSTVEKRKIDIIPDPFPHVIIDDFFLPKQYELLSTYFESVLSRGTTENTSDIEKFHGFNMDYDGYVFRPSAQLSHEDPLSIFFTLEWNRFFSKLFKQFTTFETNVALHHHPSGDRTGFIHHDYAHKYFSSAHLQNGVMPDVRDEQGNYKKCRRIIAILYFLQNGSWQDGNGGDLGLYTKDHKLAKKVAPINNRLTAFHISKNSFHAFQKNLTERNSIVQWLHVYDDIN